MSSDKVVNSIIKKLYLDPLRKKAAMEKAAKEKEDAKKMEEIEEVKLIENNDKNINAMIKNIFETNSPAPNIESIKNDEIVRLMNNIFYSDKIRKTSTQKRKRNENSSLNIYAPQLKKAKIMLEEVENEIKDLEEYSINRLFNKLSFKNTNSKTAKVTRASKAAITRKLNILREKEKALKLILKARTRSQLKKLLQLNDTKI